MLTHEEAYLCQLFVEDPAKLENYAKARRFFLHGRTLTVDQVEAMLTAYDAEWVMVKRGTLKGLVEFGMGLSCCDPISDELDDATQALETK